jgi:class 3 adenylate cyclase/tetratricopeptide (TPR) repeat protein
MKKILILFFILNSFVAFSQNESIDSLLTFLKTAKEDTMRVTALNDLSYEFSLVANYKNQLIYANEALSLAEKLNWQNGKATALNDIGAAYDNFANFPEALKNYYASLKIREEIGDKKGVAYCYNNIGIINYEIGNFGEALKNYFKALKILKELGIKYAVASVYNNIGNAYSQQNNLEGALKNLLAGLKIREEIGEEAGIATSYDNIGIIYFAMSNYEEALKNYSIGLKIRERIGDKDGLAFSYLNLAEYYQKLNKPLLSKEYTLKAHALGQEMGELDIIKRSYSSLSSADSALAVSPKTPFPQRGILWQSAYENYKLYIQFRDSITNQENTRKIVQTQMQYEFDKKEAALKSEQEKKDAIAHEEVKRQRNIRNSSFFGLAGLLLFSVIVWKQRNKIARSKKQSEELLLNILPEEVAKELKAKGRAEAQLMDEVTVLFTDFKGFTQLSEKLSPKELVAEINECFSAFDHIMQKYGVEKIKTIGDAYMAAGGLPIANTTHANDVVLAAIDIQQFMHEHKAKKEAAGELFFEIRIGVHTGPVVAGIVGVKKFAYDIWGDTVNTASRMESSGEVGKVNISGTTYALVKDKFTCTHRGKVTAKGKGEIDMYFVEGKV